MFEALLAKFSVADAAPEAVGVNVAVNDAEVPAAMVTGSDNPLTENSELVVPIEDTVTLDPVALKVPVWLWLNPTTTLPKLIVVGKTANCPGVVPVPDMPIDREGLEPFEATARDPVADPPACGAKVTLNVIVWPALNVAGGFTPLMLNPVPLGVIDEIVSAVPPELDKVSDSVLLDPAATFPKVRLDGLALTIPGDTPVPDSAMLKGELEPLLTIANVPVATPAAVGANFTETVALWLLVSVVGNVRPVMLNPLPDRFACEIVTLALPVFVMVSCTLEFCPT